MTSPLPQPPSARSAAMIWSLLLAFVVVETSALKNIGFAKYGPTPGVVAASGVVIDESTAASRHLRRLASSSIELDVQHARSTNMVRRMLHTLADRCCSNNRGGSYAPVYVRSLA